MRIFQAYFLALALLATACNSSGDKPGQQPEKTDTFKVQPIAAKPVQVNADTSYLEYVFSNYDLVNIRHLDSGILVDLRYADTGNFVKMNLYDGLRNAYLTCETAIRVCNAQRYLKEKNPNYSLVILDAARPLHIQQVMWDNTPLDTAIRRSYLAEPNQNSLHNYGCAVDITIKDVAQNKLLDMGSPFDFFGKLSQPAWEWYFLKDSTLSREAYLNRKLLRDVMRRARMNPITSEWWHFSACSKAEAALRFKLIK